LPRQVGLDDGLDEVLDELKDREIITGFKEDSDEPIFKRVSFVSCIGEKKANFFRQLLTHTSGFGIEQINPILGLA
jgi:hypothetical protein